MLTPDKMRYLKINGKYAAVHTTPLFNVFDDQARHFTEHGAKQWMRKHLGGVVDHELVPVPNGVKEAKKDECMEEDNKFLCGLVLPEDVELGLFTFCPGCGRRIV